MNHTETFTRRTNNGAGAQEAYMYYLHVRISHLIGHNADKSATGAVNAQT